MIRPVFPIAGAVLADAVRQKVVWIVLIFVAVLVFAVPSLPSYDQGVVSSVYREVTMALMFVLSIAVGLSLAVTRIPAEVSRRTVFMLLAHDVRRWHYLVGTWLGILAVVGVALAIFSAVALALGVGVYGQFMLRLVAGALAIWLESGVVIALAILVSGWYSPITALIASLAFLFAGHSVSGLFAQGALPWWLPTLDIFNVINPVAHGSGYSLVYGLAMIGAFIGWSGMLLAAGSAIFSRRDL
jgi:ABC-type transport system involved in multi-copper enzyme maturation permease subunit